MGFKFASNLQPSGTVRFTLSGVRCPGAAADVVLILKHAGKGNAAWENAKRKIDAAIRARSGTATGETLIEEMLVPFAKFVVDGWENVLEDDGKPSQPTAAKYEEFLRYLLGEGGGDILDQALAYALTRANFRDLGPEPNAADLGKK